MPRLSVEMLINCNFMNEGCDGGWELLNGMFAEVGHLVTEQCAPNISASPKYWHKDIHSCSKYAKCKPHSKVKSSYFIGKGLGDSTEKKMMKEILRNGIITTDVGGYGYISAYKTGIISLAGCKAL